MYYLDNASQTFINSLSNDKILVWSKQKWFADDNSKFEENNKVLQTGRKHCGKRRNCFSRAISPFPTVFSKDLYCRHVETRAYLGIVLAQSMAI